MPEVYISHMQTILWFLKYRTEFEFQNKHEYRFWKQIEFTILYGSVTPTDFYTEFSVCNSYAKETRIPYGFVAHKAFCS